LVSQGFSGFDTPAVSGVSSQIVPYLLMLFPAILVNTLVKETALPTPLFRVDDPPKIAGRYTKELVDDWLAKREKVNSITL
jgi:hypothetical protein